MSVAGLAVVLAGIEHSHLLALSDEYITLLAASATDRALDRLAPDAYPDDPAASAEFRRSTRHDLLDQRISDATAVRAALQAGTPVHGPQEDAEAVSVAVPRPDLDGWLRTLAGMRLVLASRLGVEHDDAHDADDPRYGTYDWLGYRLELLVQAADEYDAQHARE